MMTYNLVFDEFLWEDKNKEFWYFLRDNKPQMLNNLRGYIMIFLSQLEETQEDYPDPYLVVEERIIQSLARNIPTTIMKYVSDEIRYCYRSNDKLRHLRDLCR